VGAVEMIIDDDDIPFVLKVPLNPSYYLTWRTWGNFPGYAL